MHSQLRSSPAITHELGLGFPKFPPYREAAITAREFEPGERLEVDYAGDPIEWYLPARITIYVEAIAETRMADNSNINIAE